MATELFECRLELQKILKEDDSQKLSQLSSSTINVARLPVRDSYHLSWCDLAKLLNARHCSESMGMDISSYQLPHKEELRVHLQCLICKGPLFNPMLAWCGHAMCRVCVVRFMMIEDAYSMQCPECRCDLGFTQGYAPDEFLKLATEYCYGHDRINREHACDTQLDASLAFVADACKCILPHPLFGSYNKDITLLFGGRNYVQLTLNRVVNQVSQFRLFACTYTKTDVLSLKIQENHMTRFLRFATDDRPLVVLCLYMTTTFEEMRTLFEQFINIVNI